MMNIIELILQLRADKKWIKRGARIGDNVWFINVMNKATRGEVKNLYDNGNVRIKVKHSGSSFSSFSMNINDLHIERS